jgi:hypothetical protein
MSMLDFNPKNETMSALQTIGLEISPNSVLPSGSIMPDHFNTIAESLNFPSSSIGKSHVFIIGENALTIPKSKEDNEEVRI